MSFPNDQILFHSEDVTFELDHPDQICEWISYIINQHSAQLSFLNFIFCSDAYLHQINLDYLQHDTLTDIITFPYEAFPLIEGDIFISIERVQENAKQFQTSFEKELQRVLIHGVLHLCGQGDKTEEEKLEMRRKEEEALAMLPT